jgi:hypothetical protein
MTKQPVACDIECYRNYFLVGLKRISDGTLLQFEFSERSPLDKERLKRILLNHRVITFNGLTYDVPLIYYALEGATNEQLKRASDRIIQGNVKYWDVEDLLGIRIPRELDHIDLIEPQPNAFAALKLLAGRLHSRTLQDLPYEHDTILTHEQMDDVADYNGHDLDDTIDLFHALKDRLELREALGRQYLENNPRGFMSKSDAQIGEAIIKREVEKVTGQKVKKEQTRNGETFPYRAPEWLKFEHPELVEVMRRLADTEFVVKANGKVDMPPFLHNRAVRIGETEYAMGIGGLHSTEKERAVVADDEHVLIDFDVASYYPAIIIGSGLYPKSLGRPFIQVFDKIRQQRVAAKRAGDTTTAEGLKIALNGCFGKLGSPYSILYAPHLMIAVTLTGQLALLMLIEWAEAAGIKVVSGNTDGVVFHCPVDLEPKLMELTKRWEEQTGFELESTRYSGLYSQSVNSYIAIKENGKAKRKGPLSNPLKETPPDLRTQMMTSPSMNVCADAVVDWLTKGIPVEQTIRERDDIRDFVTVVKVDGGGTWRGKYLGKYVRFIWSKDGDPILSKKAHPTTGNHKKVSKSDGCRPVMVLPDELPIDIDYDRYIAEAREILMAIGADRRPPPQVKVRVYAAQRYDWLALAIAA